MICLYFFLWLFEEDLCFFGFYICWPTLSLKEKYISHDDYDHTECYLPKIIEDRLIIIDKEYPDSIDADSPDDRTDHIVHPKPIFSHSTCSCDKWNERTCKIVKLSENDIPKPIFLYLFMQYGCFRLSDTEPITILLYELCSIPFPDPVSKIIPEHSTDDGREDCPYDMRLPPESSYKNHDIHPWYCCPDDWKRLYASREKCYEIIPRAESLDELTEPLYTYLDPLRSCERDNHEYKCEKCKENREEFRKGFYDIFEYVFHISTIWKIKSFAKSKSQYIPINLLTSMI